MKVIMRVGKVLVHSLPLVDYIRQTVSLCIENNTEPLPHDTCRFNLLSYQFNPQYFYQLYLGPQSFKLSLHYSQWAVVYNGLTKRALRKAGKSFRAQEHGIWSQSGIKFYIKPKIYRKYLCLFLYVASNLEPTVETRFDFVYFISISEEPSSIKK